MNIFKLIVNRLYRAVLSLDQLGSAVIFGRPDHTVSSEVGYAAYIGKRWALVTQKVIDTFFGAGHCQESIEWDEINKPQFKIWK